MPLWCIGGRSGRVMVTDSGKCVRGEEGRRRVTIALIGGWEIPFMPALDNPGIMMMVCRAYVTGLDDMRGKVFF